MLLLIVILVPFQVEMFPRDDIPRIFSFTKMKGHLSFDATTEASVRVALIYPSRRLSQSTIILLITIVLIIITIIIIRNAVSLVRLIIKRPFDRTRRGSSRKRVGGARPG